MKRDGGGGEEEIHIFLTQTTTSILFFEIPSFSLEQEFL